MYFFEEQMYFEIRTPLVLPHIIVFTSHHQCIMYGRSGLTISQLPTLSKQARNSPTKTVRLSHFAKTFPIRAVFPGIIEQLHIGRPFPNMPALIESSAKELRVGPLPIKLVEGVNLRPHFGCSFGFLGECLIMASKFSRRSLDTRRFSWKVAQWLE